jgi:fumarate reductase subunit C|tara:strand:+ start:1755 stop:1979 length:225 start_codon:yes stop_codon:yes gene_type:complete
MFEVFMIIEAIAIMLLWFIVVILTAKCSVGKDAKTWQIFVFLFIAGPVGWGVVCIIAMMNLIDNVWPNLFHKKD